jgi:hypothetical protein
MITNCKLKVIVCVIPKKEIVKRCLMVLRRALRILIKKKFANANLVE